MSASFTLSLHPDAARNFDEKAEGLLPLIRVIPPAGGDEAAFRPDFHVRAQITERDIIGEVEAAFIDYRGRECGRTFVHDGKTLGLVGQGYKDLEALAARVQQSSDIRPYVSTRCLTNAAFHWARERYRGSTNDRFTAYVLRECAALVKDSEIWTPLYQVYIQSELSVGRIRFKTLTREMLDDYSRGALSTLPRENQAAFQAQFDRTRSRFQGCAAATVTVTAEPLRAQEVAGEETEYSVAALRFFHFANMTPYARSYCTPAGRENLPTTTTLTLQSGTIQQWEDRAFPAGDSSWALSKEEISELRNAGLDGLSQLLTKDERSPFENDLLDAILIYSRNSLLNDAASRLIHILAAVESLLLRDSNEPVVKNVSERLAFVVGVTLQERIAVRNNAAQVYGLRSAFLHHGRAPREMDPLELFMRHVWRGFVALIHDMDKFRTKQDLIEALERRKME
jgi:hypothetical protein